MLPWLIMFASESPAATLTQSVSQLSAQNAAAERSKMYRTGVAYSQWLDQIAKDSGNAFLQRRVFERVTWMRLLASAGALALLSILAASFVWIVRRHAGEIQSKRYQSALALTASAIRKPVALVLWMCGGAFALMPIATGIIGRPTRIFWVGTLTAIYYAGWILALLLLVFRVIRALENRERPLIQCSINARDKRKIDVELTQHGEKALGDYQGRRVDRIIERLSNLPDEDQDDLIRALNKLHTLLEAR